MERAQLGPWSLQQTSSLLPASVEFHMDTENDSLCSQTVGPWQTQENQAQCFYFKGGKSSVCSWYLANNF